MALKGHRVQDPYRTDIACFMNEAADRGNFVMYTSTVAASGAGMDQGTNLVTVAANPSGMKPAGLLVNDMVDINQTRQHINFHKDEVQKGGKVTLARGGVYTTDRVYPGVSPAVGVPAYVVHSGYLTSTNGGAAATPQVGRFLTSKDEDGFVKVEINIV